MLDPILKQKFEEYITEYDTLEKREHRAKWSNQHQIEQLVDDINIILGAYDPELNISTKQIKFHSAEINNIGLNDESFSDILFDACYPSPTAKLFSHYTNKKAFANIVTSKTLRMSNLNKNYKDGEFKEFYDDHNITGYKNKTSLMGIPTDDESIMKDIYCLCLTEFGKDRDDSAKWRTFGGFGSGVRLDFEIIPHIREFRKVYYPNPAKDSIPLLKKLFHEIPFKYSLPISFARISKVGAFYIKNEFTSENEYRFIIKTTSDSYLAKYLQPVIEKENISYITIAFNSPFADFKLVSVQPGYDFENDEVEELKEMVNKLSPGAIVEPKAIDWSMY